MLIAELIETERTYTRLLSLFVENFIQPIVASKYTILDEKNCKTMFMNVESILKINEQILTALMKENGANVATVFKNMAPFLKVYTVYVNGFDAARALFKTLYANKDNNKQLNAFQEFIKLTQQKPKLEKNTFDSFLILPVQRIPRYELLLKNVLKVTPETSSDFNDIKLALATISDIAKFVNESKRSKDTTQTLINVAQQVKSTYAPHIVCNCIFMCDKHLTVDTYFFFASFRLISEHYSTVAQV